MMWRTLRMSTANCITERQLRSVCTTRLAMLRWTKSSPGSRPTIWLAGTRLSEQPIQRYSGNCWRESLLKNSGSCRRIAWDQARLASKRCLRVLIAPSFAGAANLGSFGRIASAPHVVAPRTLVLGRLGRRRRRLRLRLRIGRRLQGEQRAGPFPKRQGLGPEFAEAVLGRAPQLRFQALRAVREQLFVRRGIGRFVG